MKKHQEWFITQCIDEQLKNIEFIGPVKLSFHWIEKDSRRDLDNICFAKKFILDALVKNKVIQGDGQKIVKGFTDTFAIDRDNPRVEVTIELYEK